MDVGKLPNHVNFCVLDLFYFAVFFSLDLHLCKVVFVVNLLNNMIERSMSVKIRKFAQSSWLLFLRFSSSKNGILYLEYVTRSVI